MNCSFKQNNKGTYTCEYCGFTFANPNVKKNCGVKREPPLYQKIINFTKAAVKHAIKGNPTVSEEVVKARLEICKSCPLFKPNNNQVGGVCTHETCGCNIQDNTNYLNKLAWADQKCPIDKWGTVEPDKNDDNNQEKGV